MRLKKTTITASGHTIVLTNPDKVLFPRDGITKRELANYYLRISETMLPHAANRLLTMHRFPDGIQAEGFYQREVDDYFPAWFKTQHAPGKQEPVTSPVLTNAAGLVYLTQLACITPHVWLSRADKLDQPDRLVFDLDPPARPLVYRAAAALGQLLRERHLPAYLQTTGSAGFHVVIPLKRGPDFDTVRDAARLIARALERRHPDLVTTAVLRGRRHGKVYLDIQRNAYAQSAVAPYAVRPRDGAPVAVPLHWDELTDSGPDPQQYTIKNIFRRLSRTADPWRDLASRAVPVRVLFRE